MPLSMLRPTLLTVVAIALSVGVVRSQGPATPAGVSITFLANEGVMLSSGTRKVLIDALFLKYETGYAVPADSTRAALERARPPFDAVDLILVTHRHGDHFHPAPVAAHLRANARATLLTSRQVIDSLRGHLSPNPLQAPRFMARTTPPGTRRRETVSGITVELLASPTAGGGIERSSTSATSWSSAGGACCTSAIPTSPRPRSLPSGSIPPESRWHYFRTGW